MDRSIFTKHAMTRCNQRGVPHRLIEAVLSMGDQEAPVGGNCVALRVSRLRLADPRVRQSLGGDADRLDGLSLILAEDTGQIVTVLHDIGGRKGRRYRGRTKLTTSGRRNVRPTLHAERVGDVH